MIKLLQRRLLALQNGSMRAALSATRVGSVVMVCLLLTACDTLSYYGQAVSGQFYILSHRQKITSLLQNPAINPDLKNRLQTVQAIREFASTQLQLPLASQYSTYVDLQRPYVVWNVFAAPEFSLQPKSWCYPVAGCVSYRGYFEESAAQAFAAGLRAQGDDVYVGGIAAYSTLGWFSDPVLSSILGRQQHQLASLIFHELAHQVVYIPGETEFNESFATAVEQEGLRRWLQTSTTDADSRAQLEAAVVLENERQQQFVALVQSATADLQLLYASTADTDAMRTGKQQRLQQLRADYAGLKEQWQNYGGYDAWFSSEINNAKLSTVVTYNKLVPAFRRLLEQCNGDLPTFYLRVAALEKLDSAQRQAELQRLLQAD